MRFAQDYAQSQRFEDADALRARCVPTWISAACGFALLESACNAYGVCGLGVGPGYVYRESN